MALATSEFARRSDRAVEIVPGAVRLSWALNGMTTADSHTLSGRFTVSAQLADNPTDRKMFAEVMLGSKQVLSIADLTDHLADAIRNAAIQIAPTRSVDQWISGDSKQEMIDALVKAASAVAFASGLEVLAPYQLDLTSPSLNEKRLQEFARARAEERSKGQVADLKRAGEVLAQFQEMRRAAPDIPAGVLLERLAPQDRGNILQTLLAASAEDAEPQTLWAVAGSSLLCINARISPPKIQTIELPIKLGPLRSIQSRTIDGKSVLLIGARTGVMAVDPSRPDEAALFSDPSIQSELGFNRVIVCGQRIWGCHGEAGLVAWHLDKPAEPETRITVPVDLQPANPSSGSARARHVSPRNLQPIDDEYAIYNVGGALKILHDTQPLDLATSNSSDVIAIIPESTRVAIIRADGHIDLLDRVSRQITGSIRGSGKTCAAAAIPWLGSIRVLLASNDGPIHCVGLDDWEVTRYTNRHNDVRALIACADQIAAMSADRQRLIIWKSSESSPATEIHVTATLRHRLADIEYV
jgi:hypothetical protein